MSPKPVYRRLFDLRLGGRRRSAAELDLEIESHIAMRVADLMAAGLAPAEARAEALRRFGDLEAARARLRAGARQRDAALLQRDRLGALAADFRYACRQMRLAPGFTALSVGALAIGIGAATAMFTFVDHVLLRPLPFAHAERLIAVTGRDSAGNAIEEVSSADWFDWRKAPSLEGSALYDFGSHTGVVTADSATAVASETVSGNFFTVLQPRFVAGRGFTEREILSGAPMVVISEHLWRGLFAADPHLSAPLRTASRFYTVVGVVAAGDEFPATTDVWFAEPLTPATDPVRVNINWRSIARLRPGATTESAAAELTSIARRIHAADPSALYDFGAAAAPLADSITGYAWTYLRLLLGVALFVVLIVCANVAAAGLARGAARSREIAVRTSLGAPRGRLVQQLLVEHVWLGVVGGLVGLAIAWVAVRVLLVRWGGQIPRAAEVKVDGRAFAFAFGLSLVAGVLAGLLPSLRVTRAQPRDLLSAGGRTAARGGKQFAGSALVTGEIALALLLLTGAALLARSLRSLLSRDIGFDTNVATAYISLGAPRYAADTARRYAFWDELLASYRAIPGVEGAAAANWIPLGLTGQSFVDIADRDVPGAGAIYRSVSDDFFRTLSIPLIVGRVFDHSQDGPTTPRVVVINRRMASVYWPNDNPIGKLVRARGMEHGANGRPADWLQIIGVVGDVRTFGLETAPRPEMYVLFRQTPSWTRGMNVVVRGRGRASSLLHEMRERSRRIDPSVAVDVGTLQDRLRSTLSNRTLMLSMLSAFASIALLLAAIGVYGVLSYAVAQRTRELAIRAALGARRRQLLGLVLVAGARVIAFGLVLGFVAALWLTAALRSMLVDVTATDPVAYAGAALTLAAVSLVAVLIPSLRATRLDPIITLQAE